MGKVKVYLFVIAILGLSYSCSEQRYSSYYDKGHAHYSKGEYTLAIPYYVKCVSYASVCDKNVVAYAYRDLAAICHHQGNHKMAYDLNERSLSYFDKAENHNDWCFAIYLSAIYTAYIGNSDDAITQLRYVSLISNDTIIRSSVKTNSALIQSGQLPELRMPTEQVSAQELYNAVNEIKYELYRKPFIIKIILCASLFLLCMFGFYMAHSGILKHIQEFRKEKHANTQLQMDVSRMRHEHQQQRDEEIEAFCEYLKTHTNAIKAELSWNSYEQMCAIVNIRYGNIVEKIDNKSHLNETELRLCVLVMIGLPRNMIAEILPYAPNSVGKLKNTVSKKLGTDGKNLQKMLRDMAISM